MPNLNDICNDMIGSVDYAYASAIIDQESGLLLGVAHNVSYITQTYLDAVAASAVEMFRGKAVVTAEKMIADLRGEEPRRQIQEIQMTTESTFHFMTVVPDKPNILVIWGDDIGQSNISAYTFGLVGYRTPNIDRIADAGVKMTSGYASCCVCAPTRASLLTGRYSQRFGFYDVGDWPFIT